MSTLLACKPQDRAVWKEFVFNLPPELRDVHFLPEMMTPYEMNGMGSGRLIVVEDARGFTMQPVLTGEDGKNRHPYNFGGPVGTSGAHWLMLNNECILNPFMADHQNELLGNRAQYIKESVWVDLTKPVKFRTTTRHVVQKAERNGLTFTASPSAENTDVSTFFKLYMETMVRNQAAPHWRLPEQWFQSFLTSLGPHALLCFARNRVGDIIGGCVLLCGFGTTYYHFAASSSDAMPLGVNQFMVAKAIELAKTQGCEKFHLGGGVKPYDGLFLFKSGFSDLRAPVYKFSAEVA